MRATAASVLATAFLLAPMTPAPAATLSGSVSFNNGLYTYSYTLSASDLPVTQVLVMFNSLGFTSWDLFPVSSTSPAGCQFNLYSGPLMGQPPGSEFKSASYWGWGCPFNGTEALSGFSFTTTHAPAANPYPYNYNLYVPGYTGGQPPWESTQVGQVVAPDLLLVPTIPEPAIALYFLAGLAGLGCVRWSAQKSGRPSRR
ncbi:hypothetical protein [Mitsuaria sp. GD03876]|uniref:hypothetical protein n=1 Tax=Mitsuaria sp. GD03876 TaxID=2975399 RepID=UPI00244A2C92|nr:hypothetical protein [Mitsuaria sp. GD03876]MDH0865856.1 hypothetical protein [Mitsuaria sp. GD03876]